MASLYDLTVTKVSLDVDKSNITSMTINVLNGDTAVTDLVANSFMIHTPENLTPIPYTGNADDKANGNYVITFTTPHPKANPLMIYAKATDGTKLSKTLYYDYSENVTGGIINTKFNLSHPGIYKFELDKLSGIDVGSLTNKTVTTSLAADPTNSKIEIVDIDTSLVQIITPTGLRVPLKLTLIDANSDNITNGGYTVSICSVKQTTPAKSSSKEEEPK